MNVLKAIKNMENEEEKQHQIIKIDCRIRMVSFTHSKPNRFQLCNVFGYGQYLIHAGMYDLFITELKSESIKKINVKDQKRINKDNKLKEKKKRILE